MTPGPNLIRQCYRCQKRFAQPTINSGNTFGAIYWTDGKTEAPKLPETPALVKCPHCKHLIWLEDAPIRGEEAPFGLGKRTPAYLTLQEVDFWIALRAGVAKEKELERYVRVRLWWMCNDQFRRESTRSAATHTALHRSNMKMLYADLSEADDEERLVKAELARELGQLREAEGLLLTSCSPTSKRYADRLSELTRQGSTRVDMADDNHLDRSATTILSG